MAQDLAQAIKDATEALKGPEQVALKRDELARFLRNEVRSLEAARDQKKEAKQLEEAAQLLNKLNTAVTEAGTAANTAVTNAAVELKKYIDAKGGEIPPDVPTT